MMVPLPKLPTSNWFACEPKVFGASATPKGEFISRMFPPAGPPGGEPLEGAALGIERVDQPTATTRVVVVMFGGVLFGESNEDGSADILHVERSKPRRSVLIGELAGKSRNTFTFALKNMRQMRQLRHLSFNIVMSLCGAFGAYTVPYFRFILGFVAPFNRPRSLLELQDGAGCAATSRAFP